MPPEVSGPVFLDLYRAAAAMPVNPDPIQTDDRRVTVSAQDQTVGQFLRFLSNETGVSVVAASVLDGQRVSVEAVDQRVVDVLGAVARRLGAELTKSGGIYYLGELKTLDQAVLVRRVRGLRRPDLERALAALSSTFGGSAVFEDGLIIITDRVELIQRVTVALDQLEAARSPVWVVQFFIVDTTEADDREFGFDVVPMLELSATLARASSGIVTPTDGAQVAASLSAALRATRERSASAIITDPLFILGDGRTAKVKRGGSFPIATRTTSPEGTVSITGYVFKQTGLELSVELRETGDEYAELAIMLSMSEVVRLVANEAPEEVNMELETTARLASGGVYLVGSADRVRQRDTITGPVQAAARRVDERSTVRVWCRAYRIDGGVNAAKRSGGRAASDAAEDGRLDVEND